MNTSVISAEVDTNDIPILKALFKRLKAQKVVVRKKDSTEMTKEVFFDMIDEARNSEKVEMEFEELKRIIAQ